MAGSWITVPSLGAFPAGSPVQPSCPLAWTCSPSCPSSWSLSPPGTNNAPPPSELQFPLLRVISLPSMEPSLSCPQVTVSIVKQKWPHPTPITRCTEMQLIPEQLLPLTGRDSHPLARRLPSPKCQPGKGMPRHSHFQVPRALAAPHPAAPMYTCTLSTRPGLAGAFQSCTRARHGRWVSAAHS